MRQCGTAVQLDRIIRRADHATERAALARVSPCRASCVGDIDQSNRRHAHPSARVFVRFDRRDGRVTRRACESVVG
jgi:hypothetical protein